MTVYVINEYHNNLDREDMHTFKVDFFLSIKL